MIHVPVVVGMTLCNRFDVDEQTGENLFRGIFHALHFAAFPSLAIDFAVYLALTDGVGEGIMELVTEQLETEALIHRYRRWFVFPSDRLLIVNLLLPIQRCVFPAPGRYTLTLRLDGEFVAHRSLEIFES